MGKVLGSLAFFVTRLLGTLGSMGCRSFPQTNVVDAPKKIFYFHTFHTRVDHSRTNLGAEKRESRVPNPSCPLSFPLQWEREKGEERGGLGGAKGIKEERQKRPLTFSGT